MRKTTLEPHLSCSVQETAPKISYYSKNDNFSKIGNVAIALNLQNRQFGSKIKILKNIPKTTLDPH